MRHVMHKKSAKTFPVIDGLAYFVGIFQPIMTIPQIIQVAAAQDASQISLWTWLAYDAASIVLIIYGIKHRLAPIVVSQAAWIIVQTILIILIFIY